MQAMTSPPVTAGNGVAAAKAVAATKIYGTGSTAVTALDDVTVDLPVGRFTAIMGPSGSGKSTLMHCLAGLDDLTDGQVFIGDTELNRLPEKQLTQLRRDRVGFVFQAYNLVPTLTALENITLPAALAGRRQDEGWLRAVLDATGLADRVGHRPAELSGGQQQRVALARALAHPPRLLLLDEPFSNLDAKLRARAREWLKRLQRSLGVTTVFVTHDQDEALSMSDTIVVMEGGRIHQVGTPEAIYQEPADLFVADFVGTVNLLPGEVVASAHDHVDVGLDDSPLVLRVACPSGPAPAAGGRVVVAVRPEAVAVHDDASRAGRANVVTAPVVDRSYLGDHYRYSLRLGATTLVAQADRQLGGSHLTVEIPPDRARLFPAEPKAATDATDATDVDLDPAEEASVA